MGSIINTNAFPRLLLVAKQRGRLVVCSSHHQRLQALQVRTRATADDDARLQGRGV